MPAEDGDTFRAPYLECGRSAELCVPPAECSRASLPVLFARGTATKAWLNANTSKLKLVLRTLE